MALQKLQPESKMFFDKPGNLIWIGKIKPTLLSAEYTVKITLKKGGSPKIKVLNPELRARDNRPIPHMYGQERLCVYNPRKYQWNHRMKMAETIFGWISMWLYFYEIWQASGQWLGGGDDHSPSR